MQRGVYTEVSEAVLTVIDRYILLRIDGGGIVILQKFLKHFHSAQMLNGTK